ncbi:hypothetical protein [Streptomyces sp. NPDC005408]|uniref:hypothetical protein n=1 Tax=Streptomyces sp. NPDC005408 TaxID=3155341 RepID=UPI0033B27A90
MGSQGREILHDPQAEHVCPACGQPVTTVVKRHKTLGTFVPLWGPGPCHNPECPEYVDRGEHRGAKQPERPGGEAGGEAGGESGAAVGSP